MKSCEKNETFRLTVNFDHFFWVVYFTSDNWYDSKF